MTVEILDTRQYLHDMELRMPFHFANTTITELPHLFLSVDVNVDGETHTGVTAEGLSPVWFIKEDLPFEEGIEWMLAVVDNACEIVSDLEADTVFELWRDLFERQGRWADGTMYPPLLWSFGVSMVERAAIDAFCRATQSTFAEAVRENAFGIELGNVYNELAGRDPSELLPETPQERTTLRHTVGFTDPLTDDQIDEEDRLDDGLPQSLVAYIRTQGLTHFKIKISGDAGRDADRLRRIAAVLDSECPGEYAFTLDANEQYGTVREFKREWEVLESDPDVAAFLEKLLYVEQPLARDEAFGEETAAVLTGWDDGPPVIIDESDGHIDSFGRALSNGYAGTSHKNCKGVFRGVLNACLAAQRRRADPDGEYVVSGEDLTTVGPVGLQQDLAVLATIGADHVERNGHHYFRGLSMFPDAVQDGVLRDHDDLYRRHRDGFATVDVSDGDIAFESAVLAPFGYHHQPDLTRFDMRSGSGL